MYDPTSSKGRGGEREEGEREMQRGRGGRGVVVSNPHYDQFTVHNQEEKGSEK